MIENNNYIYDIETYPNIFMLTCINANVHLDVVSAYERAAIDNNVQLMKQLEPHLDVKCFIVSHEYRNDLPLLLSFMSRHKLMIGYNNHNYDNLILDYICMYGKKYNKDLRNAKGEKFNDVIYRISGSIISYGSGYSRIFKEEYDMQYYKRLYSTFDIQRILYLDKRFVSLKQVAILLKWYLVLDLPYDPTETLNLTDELVEALRFYNINDCLITKRVVDESIEEINLRQKVSKLYGINVINESRSGIANRYFIKVYAEKAGIKQADLVKLRTYRHTIKVKDLLSPKLTFNSDRLNDLLFEVKNKVIAVGSNATADKFIFDVSYGNKVYVLAKGGLHSKDYPSIYTSDDEYVYIDSDVTSFYPYIMILLEACPKHLDKAIFIELLQDIVLNRVSAKDLAKKINLALKKQLSDNDVKLLEQALEQANTKAEALKIVVNAIYGKTGDEHSPLYDLVAMYKTTINGQLFLLMLIEMLHQKGFINISANTDGVITKVKRSRLEEYYVACKEWEELTGFTLEYTFYEKYICYAVNDYIAIKEGFSSSTETNDIKLKKYVKKKGIFLTDLSLDKGYFAPIVAKTLEAYYCFNQSIENTILNHTDIYDFCISKKTNEDFKSIFKEVDKETKEVIERLLQKNNRFYITSKSTGGFVKAYKHPRPNKKGVIVKEISVVAKQNIAIFNKFYKVEDFEEYNVDYRFYYNEVMKIFSPLEDSTRTLFS